MTQSPDIKIGELVGRLTADLRDYYSGNGLTVSHRCRKAAESLVDIVRVLEAQQNEINILRDKVKNLEINHARH